MKKKKIVDRKRGPSIQKITSLDFPHMPSTTLSNGATLVEVNMGTQNLVQVELLFPGSRFLEKKKGEARAASILLKDGTETAKGAQIAEEIDFYGANIRTGASLDYTYVKMFALNKYFLPVLTILKDILENPSFPESELQKYKKNSIQRLKVEMAKSEIIAYKTITEELYGGDHPYGYNSSEKIYNNLTRDDLIDYHKRGFGMDNCTIIASGNITPEVRNAIIDAFGNNMTKCPSIKYSIPSLKNTPKRIKLETEEKLQTAIKIGCRVFDRNHPDFADLFILNTIYGGYFGSRLMTKLREEKGYTYNIYSSIDMMVYDGYFNISTEVGNEYLQDTVAGIYEEMKILTEEKVQAQELEMVKNYLSGNFLNMVDGPFKLGNMVKVLALNNLDTDFYKKLMARIHAITAEEIQAVAQKYFIKENMVEVIVG